MNGLHSIARALGGTAIGRNTVVCPGPGHSARDRSLSVTFAPDGTFIAHSFTNDDWRECRDLVKARLGLGDVVRIVPNNRPVTTGRAGDTREPALDIWRQSRPIKGTPVETYLARRGVPFDDLAGEVLRWHGECPFGGQRTGAMVALIRNVLTNEPQGIHRTAIAADGTKRAELGSNGRLTLGTAKGGAIKLADDCDVSTVLAIGEGIETTLAIRTLPDLSTMPVWAVLSAGGIEHFPALAGLETIWIGVDHDASGTGDRVAMKAAERLHVDGIDIVFIRPKGIGDLADRVAA